MRGERPFIVTDLMGGAGVDDVIGWIRKSVLFEEL
jgi:urease accessory protein